MIEETLNFACLLRANMHIYLTQLIKEQLGLRFAIFCPAFERKQTVDLEGSPDTDAETKRSLHLNSKARTLCWTVE